MVSLSTFGQKIPGKFDPNTWVPSYKFATPTGWTSERISFPIPFAPQIPYVGAEDIRFAPGWGKVASQEYWSYCFVWWLDGAQTIDAPTLQENFKLYFSGLIAQNRAKRFIPSKKLIPTNPAIQKIKTMPNDVDTYRGTISMLDYMAQRPIVLNCLIHKKNCTDQKNTVLFVELSPKPAEHSIWQQLNKIQETFSCKK